MHLYSLLQTCLCRAVRCLKIMPLATPNDTTRWHSWVVDCRLPGYPPSMFPESLHLVRLEGVIHPASLVADKSGPYIVPAATKSSGATVSTPHCKCNLVVTSVVTPGRLKAPFYGLSRKLEHFPLHVQSNNRPRFDFTLRSSSLSTLGMASEGRSHVPIIGDRQC